jgi:hypothetical protein
MTKGQILTRYHLFPEGRHWFDRWLQASAVIGLISGAALVAVALYGSQTSEPTIVSTSTRAQTISFQEQHGLAHLDNLPVIAVVFSAAEFSTESTTFGRSP